MKDRLMSSERNLRKNGSTQQWSAIMEHQSQQTAQRTAFPDVHKNRQQRRTQKYTTTNQPRTEALAPDVETNPRLATIVTQLGETTPSTINPDFKEKLREDLLNQFVAHFHGNKVERQNPFYRVYRLFLHFLGCFHR